MASIVCWHANERRGKEVVKGHEKATCRLTRGCQSPDELRRPHTWYQHRVHQVYAKATVEDVPESKSHCSLGIVVAVLKSVCDDTSAKAPLVPAASTPVNSGRWRHASTSWPRTMHRIYCQREATLIHVRASSARRSPSRPSIHGARGVTDARSRSAPLARAGRGRSAIKYI